MNWKDADNLSALVKNLGKALTELGDFIGQYSRAAQVRSVIRSAEHDVKDLELSVRAHNILDRENIRTIEKLVTFTREDLLHFRNCAERTVDEIASALLKRGCYLRDEKPMVPPAEVTEQS